MKSIDPANCFDDDLDEKLRQFNVGGHDCPVFDAMFQYVSLSTRPSSPVPAIRTDNQLGAQVYADLLGRKHRSSREIESC